MSVVIPAVLPSSREDLEDKLALFATLPDVTRVQIDVVDGYFAAPASWPYTAPKDLQGMRERGEMLSRLNHFSYEIDLMCRDADKAAGEWLALGALYLTFHAESTPNLPELFDYMQRQYGPGAGFSSQLVSFGVAINIASDLALIESSLPHISYVQFMGIAEIGKQGQPFDERVFEKMRIFHNKYPDIPIQVDGGVSLRNAKKLIALGATSLVVGSGLLRASDPKAVVREFDAIQSPYGV
jgi:ribulose-phosphate 3-epimerase